MEEKQEYRSTSPGLPAYHPAGVQHEVAAAPTAKPNHRPDARYLAKTVALILTGWVGYQLVLALDGPSLTEGLVKGNRGKPFEHVCQQAPVLDPKYDNLTDVYQPETKNRIINWHSGAIQVPTQSFDDLGAIGEDSRWDIFAKFHEYLEHEYPSVYSTFDVTKIETYGLVMEWKGSDDSKKPLLLMGHQDVVPVNPATEKDWTHPPFSGHVDDQGWIWGRGAVDDKSGLISLM